MLSTWTYEVYSKYAKVSTEASNFGKTKLNKTQNFLSLYESTINGKLLKYRVALSLDEKNLSSVSISPTLLSVVIRKIIFLVSEGVEHITTGSNDIPTKENTTKLAVPYRYQTLDKAKSLTELFKNLSVMR